MMPKLRNTHIAGSNDHQSQEIADCKLDSLLSPGIFLNAPNSLIHEEIVLLRVLLITLAHYAFYVSGAINQLPLLSESKASLYKSTWKDRVIQSFLF